MSNWKKSILLFCKRHNFRQSYVFSQVVIHTFLLSLNEISLLNIFRDILNLSLKFRECMKDSVCDTHNYQSIFWIFSINFPQSLKSKWKDKTLFSYESMSSGCWPTEVQAVCRVEFLSIIHYKHIFIPSLFLSLSLFGGEEMGRNCNINFK